MAYNTPMSAIPAINRIGSRSAPLIARPVIAKDSSQAQAQPLIPVTGGQKQEGVKIEVIHNDKLGDILADANGMVVYIHTMDDLDHSNCTGGCLQAWPAVTTRETPQAGRGVDPALLGVVSTLDGRNIVTYNHFPLYYSSSDIIAGSTAGQAVDGTWYTIAPMGEPVFGQ